MPRDRRKLRQGGAVEISDEARKAQHGPMVRQAEQAAKVADEAEEQTKNNPTPALQVNAKTLRATADALAAALLHAAGPPKPKARRRE